MVVSKNGGFPQQTHGFFFLLKMISTCGGDWGYHKFKSSPLKPMDILERGSFCFLFGGALGFIFQGLFAVKLQVGILFYICIVYMYIHTWNSKQPLCNGCLDKKPFSM